MPAGLTPKLTGLIVAPDTYKILCQIFSHQEFIDTLSNCIRARILKDNHSMQATNNHQTAKIVSAGLTGTTAMTLFSYLVSEIKDEKFKEPRLLAELLHRIEPGLNKKTSHIVGWNLHYAVGLMFAILYAQQWDRKQQKATIASGLLLGGLSGIFAIVVWRSVFKLHPSPPKIKFKRYYGHLLIAHFVFGAFASVGYNLIKSTKR